MHDNRAHGAGAFGGGGPGGAEGGALDGGVRDVVVPLLRGSFLETAARTRAPHVGPVTPGRGNTPLLEGLGGPPPREAAVLPLLAGRAIVSLLYGDNGTSGRSIGDLRGLEIFLAQAGIALQNASLQRSLTALSGRDGSAPHA